MAYWWVTQNKTFAEERAGGYLWAPLVDRRGSVPHHWRSVGLVKKGDTIFSYFRGSIVSQGEAISAPYAARKPAHFDKEGLWEIDGQRVDLSYADLKRPLGINDIADQLAQHLPVRYSPLTTDFRGVQGYLFSLPDAAGKVLDALAHRNRA